MKPQELRLVSRRWLVTCARTLRFQECSETILTFLCVAWLPTSFESVEAKLKVEILEGLPSLLASLSDDRALSVVASLPLLVAHCKGRCFLRPCSALQSQFTWQGFAESG